MIKYSSCVKAQYYAHRCDGAPCAPWAGGLRMNWWR
ncbi:hypothetical protein BACCAP_03999 [Pseudoflavonifractor capillosus ATCC 29799]|uniref:Uncharacterized protein n=1 Tax=Pseudoflavonifractor capillosus ATCC 29799 TaxID=411467 RepID=A6P0I8_9FIRM|nr:hypothetical protein BACCAP_03999 [Pseudoflavonifractor capillosus ATCC 29799]